MIICSKCISSEEHGGHKIERYEKKIQKIKQELSRTVPEVERRFPTINIAIDNAEIVSIRFRRCLLILHVVILEQ